MNGELDFDIISPTSESINTAVKIKSSSITLPKRPKDFSSLSPLEFLSQRTPDYIVTMEDILDATDKTSYKIRILEFLLGKSLPNLSLIKGSVSMTFETILQKLKDNNCLEEEP